MSIMNKIVSIILASTIPMGSFTISVYAQENVDKAGTSASTVLEDFNGTLKFDENGDFRILTFTDIHIDEVGTELDEQTIAFMHDAIKATKPQLVVFTGDMTNPLGTDTLDHLKHSIKVGLTPVKEAGIAFALVFGNHDFGNIPEEMRKNDVPDKAALLNLYAQEAGGLFLNTWAQNSEDHLVTQYNDKSGGVTNFNYPIYNSDGTKVINNLYFFDEGSTQSISQYAGVMPDQSEWYKKTSDMLITHNGGEIVPSLVFQHTIVPEIYEAFSKGIFPFFEDYMTKTVDDQTYIFLPDYKKIKGSVMEWPCPPSFATDEFDSWVQQGDIMAAAFGHDHTNNFTYETRGITLIGMPSTSLLRGTSKSRGAMLFTLTEDKSNIKTYKQEYISYQDVKEKLDDEATVTRTRGTSSELRLIIYAFHEVIKKIIDIFE